MSEAVAYRVNRPHVINETIDGETVMIDLRTGTYYSLDAIGAEIWRAVEAQAAGPALVGAVVSRYGGAPGGVGRGVGHLLDRPLGGEAIVAGGRPRGAR